VNIKQDQSADRTEISCSGSSRNSIENEGAPGLCFSIFSYCPYTMFLKKNIGLIKGETYSPHEPPRKLEVRLKSKTMFGVGIILIGVFCPVFWISFITGAPMETLIMSAFNSLLVILFGVFYIVYYRIQFRKEMEKEKIREQSSFDYQ
jgi:hypothetical protein